MRLSEAPQKVKCSRFSLILQGLFLSKCAYPNG